jgi:hypothetical protein
VVREPDDARLAQVRVDEGDVAVSIDLTAGDVRGMVLESGADVPPRRSGWPSPSSCSTTRSRSGVPWLSRSSYTGRWREALHRSAITLKLMTYAPTGGLVAAPDRRAARAGRGERNWDYRYTWVRDALVLGVRPAAVGFTEEAAQFSGWLRDRVLNTSAAKVAR